MHKLPKGGAGTGPWRCFLHQKYIPTPSNIHALAVTSNTFAFPYVFQQCSNQAKTKLGKRFSRTCFFQITDWDLLSLGFGKQLEPTMSKSKAAKTTNMTPCMRCSIRIALQLIIFSGSFCSCIWQGNHCPCQDKDRIWITRNLQTNQNKSTISAPQVHHMHISSSMAKKQATPLLNLRVQAPHMPPFSGKMALQGAHCRHLRHLPIFKLLRFAEYRVHRLSTPLEALLGQALGSLLPAMDTTKNVRKCSHSSASN